MRSLFFTPFAVATLVTVIFSGCSSAPSLNPLDWWATDRGLKISDLPEIKGTSHPRILWQVNAGPTGKTGLSPAVSSGNAYAAGSDGAVLKINIKTGNSIWRTKVSGAISGGVGSDGVIVVLGTNEGEIIALDAQDGRVRWRSRVSSEVLAAPVVEGDFVLVRSADSRVFAMDARDGRRRWVYQRSAASLSIRNPAGLVVAHGNAYGGFSGGKLVAIALSNGGVRWEATVALPQGTNELDRVTDVVGLPWVSEREVCAVAFQGRVACFDASNGSPLWGRAMSSVSGLSADAGYVFVSDDSGAIHALDRTSGSSVWKQDRLLRRVLTSPLPLGRKIVVGDIQGYVHMLARDSGTFEGRTATDGSAISVPPVATDGGFLVQTRNGNLFSIAPQ